MTIDSKIWLKIAVILSLMIKPTGTFEAKHCQEMSTDVKKVKNLKCKIFFLIQYELIYQV